MTYGGFVSFGDYIFPTSNQGRISARFVKSRRAQQVRVPGMDGSWDGDGFDASPVEAAALSVEFTVIAATRSEMDGHRDALLAMLHYGLDVLAYQNTNVALASRWTLARVTDVRMSENKGEHSDLWQEVRLTCFAPEPSWKVNNYGGLYIGQAGLIIDDPNSNTIGEGGYSVSASGLTTAVTLPYVGNAPAIPSISIEPQSGQTCENVRIRRLDGNYPLDDLQYTGTLTYGQILAISGRKQTVTVDAVPAWDDFSYDNPDFLRLEPGQTDLVIYFTNVGDAATVRFHYFDEYR